MKRRVGIIVLAVLGVLAFAFCLKLLLKEHALHDFRVFVESDYKPQMGLIEREMLITREERDDSYIEARTRIQQALSLPEVFSARWTSDGHHGLDSLKQLPIAYTYSPGSETAETSHWISFGKADDGTKLLVYGGWIPSGWKREYHVAFRLSAIQDKMKAK